MTSPTDSPVRTRRRGRVLASSAVVLAGLLFAACGSSDGSGTSSKTTAANDSGSDSSGGTSVLGTKDPAKGTPVSVGFITDGKNPSTDQSIELDVSKAVVDYLNDYKGGIGGHPIELTQCEAKLDPGKGADCANQMVEKKVAAVLVGTTGVTTAVWQPLHDAGVPTFFYAAGDEKLSSDPTSTFTMSGTGTSLIDLAAGVAKEHGKKKVTAVVIDVPAALPSFQGPSLDIWKQKGVSTVDLIRVAPGTADMTPQLSKLSSEDPGLVYVLGNDTFCISAFQALQNLNVKAPMAMVGPCLTDATRKAIPGSYLKGAVVSAQAPLGDTGEATALVRAVDKAYGNGWDLSRTAPFGTFEVVAAFGAVLHDLKGAVTADDIIKTVRSAPEMELPGSGGLKFRCNGKADPKHPAVCVRGTLAATLDGSGQPGSYKAVGATPIPD